MAGLIQSRDSTTASAASRCFTVATGGQSIIRLAPRKLNPRDAPRARLRPALAFWFSEKAGTGTFVNFGASPRYLVWGF